MILPTKSLAIAVENAALPTLSPMSGMKTFFVGKGRDEQILCLLLKTNMPCGRETILFLPTADVICMVALF